MTTAEKVKIVFVTLAALLCFSIFMWWAYIQVYAPGKLIVQTYKGGEIQTVDGSQKDYIFRVKYYSNENKNGLEMLDISFANFIDEKKDALYWQGYQVVANSVDDNFVWYWRRDVQHASISSSSNWGSYDYIENAQIFKYASADKFETTLGDGKTLTRNSAFRISLGDYATYRMKFQGDNTTTETAYQLKREQVLWVNHSYYAYNDVNLLAHNIYNQVKTLANGTKQTTVFKWGDMFDYYKYDAEKKQYSSERVTETSNVKTLIDNYYVVEYEKSADGAMQSSDSLFGVIANSPNFYFNDNYKPNDYYTGKSIVKLDFEQFDKVTVTENKVALKLKESFLEVHKKLKDKIILKVEIDIAAMNNSGYEFVGFTKDNGLKNFTVAECYKLETINGNQVKTEVAYEF